MQDVDRESLPGAEQGDPGGPPEATPGTGAGRSRDRRTLLVVAVLVVVLAGAAVAVWTAFFRSSTPATTYRTATVSAATLKQTVSVISSVAVPSTPP